MGTGRPQNWVLEAFDPLDQTGVGRRQVWLAQALIEKVSRGVLTPKFYRIQLIPEVLLNPLAVFEGWDRPGHDRDFCYVGIPSKDVRSESIEVPAPPGMAFLVFVTARGNVTDWRWEVTDTAIPGYPENWRQRFGRKLWPIDPPS